MPSNTADETWPLPELTRARRAIVVVDVVESVRLMQEDEAGFIERWRRFVHEVRADVLPAFNGRMVKSLGDGMLLTFETSGQAVGAVFAMQQRLARLAEFAPAGADPLQLRWGLNESELVGDDLDVYGAGVNLAARLGSLAQPGEAVSSSSVRDGIVPGVDADVHDLGECWVKNLDAPVRAYRLASPQPALRCATLTGTTVSGAVAASDKLPRVAVLPLRPRQVQASALAAGDLLSEEVAASLSRSRFFSVVSRLSAAAVCDRPLSAAQIGMLLEADYLVSGTVDLDGERFVARVELVQVSRDTIVWADRVAGRIADLLAGQDSGVNAIVAAVSGVIVDHEVARVTSAPLPTLASHWLLMAGIGHLHRSARQDFERSRQLLESLAERHSRSPHALAWLGKWHVLRAVQGFSDNAAQDAERAIQLAQRALDTDASSALALTLCGHVFGFLKKDLPAAQRHIELSLSLNPNEPLTWIYLAALRAWQGRGQEAVQASERALALSPLDPMRYYYDTLAAFAAMTAGQYDQAKALALRSLQAHRLHLSTHRTLSIAQWRLGEHEAARQTVQDMLAIDPSFSVRKYLERYPGGDNDDALANAQTLRACGVPH